MSIIKNTNIHVLCIVIIFFALIFGIGVVRYGSIAATFAALHGQCIVVVSDSKTFGTAQAGETQAISFHLQNITQKPIIMLGANYSCTCTLSGFKFPKTLPPSSTTELTFMVKPPASRPDFQQSIILYTDQPNQSEIKLSISGTVIHSHQLEATQIDGQKH